MKSLEKCMLIYDGIYFNQVFEIHKFNNKYMPLYLSLQRLQLFLISLKKPR